MSSRGFRATHDFDHKTISWNPHSPKLNTHTHTHTQRERHTQNTHTPARTREMSVIHVSSHEQFNQLISDGVVVVDFFGVCLCVCACGCVLRVLWVVLCVVWCYVCCVCILCHLLRLLCVLRGLCCVVLCCVVLCCVVLCWLWCDVMRCACGGVCACEWWHAHVCCRKGVSLAFSLVLYVLW